MYTFLLNSQLGICLKNYYHSNSIEIHWLIKVLINLIKPML